MNWSIPRPNTSDDDLAGFDDLLADGVPGPVSAVYDMAGSKIEDASRIQASWSPGKQLTTRYRVHAAGGELDGRRDVVATVGEIPDGAAVVESSGTRVGLWVVPNDPLLTGLPSALHVPTVTRLLSDLGFDRKVRHTRLRAYRPGRRAVVEVDAGDQSIFLKVVPPSDVDSLHRRHRFLSDLLPVPDSLGLDRELGVVVMPALSGVDLRTALRRGDDPPRAAAVAAMLDGLADPPDRWKSRSPVEVVPKVVDLLSRLLPDESGRLQELAGEIGTDVGEPSVAVHGDFHEAQILVDARGPIGLLDVDTFGWGRPGDDAATMLGHLHLLAPGCRKPASAIDLARALNRHWDGLLDPVDLRRKTGAVVLGLATGPFRVQSPDWPGQTLERITRAEDWAKSARRVHERSLIPTSEGSYVAVR